MEHKPTLDTLLDSCTVLFGPHLDISRNFLDYIEISGVKNAFRKRARETHPDLAGDISEDVGSSRMEGFQRVRESYENLKNYIKKRDDGRLGQRLSRSSEETSDMGQSDDGPLPFAAATNSANDTVADHGQYTAPRQNGCFPSRKLMLGDYLYFAGVAEWQDIIRALVWQKASRPRLGDLGCSFGWLQQKDITRIIQYQRSGGSFGESAVRLGLLDRRQRDRLVLYQRCKQQKIGQYFVVNGFLVEIELLMFVNMLGRHNAFHPDPY